MKLTRQNSGIFLPFMPGWTMILVMFKVNFSKLHSFKNCLAQQFKIFILVLIILLWQGWVIFVLQWLFFLKTKQMPFGALSMWCGEWYASLPLIKVNCCWRNNYLVANSIFSPFSVMLNFVCNISHFSWLPMFSDYTRINWHSSIIFRYSRFIA